MIDLHLHTTASDGRCTPSDLVARAAAVGIRTMAVTDHDTMAGVAPAAAAAAAAGIEFVPGVEITAVHGGRDVHMLAYYVADTSPQLLAVLEAQRHTRVHRARAIADRLAALGAPIDIERLIGGTQVSTGRSLARPQIAAALVEAGHVASIADAFDRFLSEGRPAYLPVEGKSPDEIVQLIAELGGIVALAHPGPLKRDELIPRLADAGLTAIEAHHSAHSADERRHYVAMARRLGLGISGGSDFHGPGTRRAEFFGVVSLPADAFADLGERAARARRLRAP